MKALSGPGVERDLGERDRSDKQFCSEQFEY